MRLTIEIETNMTTARSEFVEAFKGKTATIIMKDGHEYEGHWIHNIDVIRGVVGLKSVNGGGIVYERVMDIKKMRLY